MCALLFTIENVSAVSQQSVKASCFDDRTGYRGANLYSGYYYAELSTNPLDSPNCNYKALGGLSNGHRLKITYNGKSITALKGDVGCGGRNNPKLDLHLNAVKALGFSSCNEFGLRNIIIESV